MACVTLSRSDVCLHSRCFPRDSTRRQSLGCLCLCCQRIHNIRSMDLEAINDCDSQFTFQAGPSSVDSGQRKLALWGTSGHKRGASAQAHYRDSSARETGPQI
ncbi:unnamed protein product [Pleuronectes platessa]|uniref:Uncharacterized protein n=1 Tax=Pleuronectes platessa TaxID=8262 RepID=A0A9N7VEB6_PLEPL|nr:unnamed protein product [Pleuronectes platessa]